MRRVWARLLVAVVVCALCLAPAPALALTATTVEPGVTIDEGSPAAKEYALALSQARRAGSSGARSNSKEAPFGAGITPPSSGGRHSTPGAARSGHSSAARSIAGTANAESSGSPSTLPAAVLRAARSPASTGGGSALALLGGGVAILVLGALGGIVLRHNRRPPSHA
jgi:hypothetical protein